MIWQWVLRYETKSTGTKEENRSKGLHQNLKLQCFRGTTNKVKEQPKDWEKYYRSSI